MIGVRLQPETLARLDAWIATCPAPAPTRPAAIRLLLQASLEMMARQAEPEDQ